MKPRYRMWLIMTIVLLSGCSGMNANFDCPMKNGVRCESLDQVNARVDRGDIGRGEMQSVSLQATQQNPVNRHVQARLVVAGEPLRYGETVQRVWIAPYEDTSGNYHQESEVYTVARPGKWIGNPLAALNEDGV